MSRDKQIEEMTIAICGNYADGYCVGDDCGCEYGCIYEEFANRFYNAGYRKSQDVAEEIFAEIEQNLNNLIRYYKEKRKYVTEIEYSEFEQRYCDIKIRTFEERLLKIAELKKKYTKEK